MVPDPVQFRIDADSFAVRDETTTKDISPTLTTISVTLTESTADDEPATAETRV